ncbi:peptidoglycan DD-metalloendopeptidase family protein [Kribbella sp. CA-294648]|uniref:peptidoglycan DD-metalloendopeptidase family protein n=1 Tax=Kribbella sp. CA-294648 TaxID=3239948 RepID=UPI003D8E31C7
MTPFLLTPLTIALLTAFPPAPVQPPPPPPHTAHHPIPHAPRRTLDPTPTQRATHDPTHTPRATLDPSPTAVWPLTPRPAIVRGFEPPPKPWLSGHRGLDLSGSPGQQVRSATPGTVTYAAPLAGRGVIVITNGPLRTTYEPVIPTVRVGTPVTPGTPLGHLSAAGSHCAPATCLHWGLLKATTYLNPLSLLPHHPIRLLPLTPTPQAQLTPPARPPTARQQLTPPPPTPARPHRELPHGSAAQFRDPLASPPRSSAIPRHPDLAAPPRAPHHPPDQQPLPAPAPHTSFAAEAPPRGELTSGVLVSLAAAATLIGSLLIRRH